MSKSKNIIKSMLAFLCTSAIFMLAPSASAVGTDGIYIKDTVENIKGYDIIDEIIVEEVDELDAQSEEAADETTLSLYDYDHMLPFYSVNISKCNDAESIKEIICDEGGKYIPSLDDNGDFDGYTQIDDENEWVAYHAGGIYDFIYNDMTAVVESELGTSFDEIYFTSDSLFNSVGILAVKDGTETYFDVRAYYSIKNVNENYNDGKYLYTTEEFLSAGAAEYEMVINDDGDGGVGLSYSDDMDEVVEEEVEVVEEAEDISSRSGAYEESKIASADDFGIDGVIISLAIFMFIGAAVKCTAKKRHSFLA